MLHVLRRWETQEELDVDTGRACAAPHRQQPEPKVKLGTQKLWAVRALITLWNSSECVGHLQNQSRCHAEFSSASIQPSPETYHYLKERWRGWCGGWCSGVFGGRLCNGASVCSKSFSLSFCLLLFVSVAFFFCVNGRKGPPVPYLVFLCGKGKNKQAASGLWGTLARSDNPQNTRGTRKTKSGGTREGGNYSNHFIHSQRLKEERNSTALQNEQGG